MDGGNNFRIGLELPLPAATDVTGQRTRAAAARPRAHGKFLYVDDRKLWVKGVTYGTFRGEGDATAGYPSPSVVHTDFSAMVAAGINTVRTYTVPPRWLLDAAAAHGLRLMIGLPWEQHIAFLDDRRRADDIVRRVREGVRACANHRAVLCFAVGNEIPASIVRWHGRRRVEQFLERLYRAVKQEDPAALVTYVNYPTTEYLQLPFLDVVCFNVYLESEERLSAYLARLQTLAGERPLVLGEIGLDSQRNGVDAQGASLAWQLRTAFTAGCAGTFVFAWTDEWHRGGHDIADWDFGLTTRDRLPKPALAAVSSAYRAVPFASEIQWPRVSVVVCSYNGSRTIRDTLEGLKRLDYPDYEVIVVNDGSSDATADIAREYPVRLISTENRGLSNARNTGWQAATGEIIAYIDDDAYPDPHWLKYLAHTFLTTTHDAVGGPNIAPPGDGPIADCVANAPGGPVHVLLTDSTAEHIPGCNMAFRRSALERIGGFDPRYRTAGDDVDVCWRLMDTGGTIGFHAAAMDWHHRRNSLRMYWRQQKGYGKAEALLEEKWPERYNAAGHLVWTGRLYGKGCTEPLRLWRWNIYQGTWGTAPYQSLYERQPGTLASLPLMPEWYLLIAALGILSALGTFWPILAMITVPLLVLAIAAPIGQAIAAGLRASFPTPARSRAETWRKRGLTAVLHLVQPAARLIGRLQHGLSPWRKRGIVSRGMRLVRKTMLWSETARAADEWMRALEASLREQGSVVICAGDYDHWDLHVRGGLFGAARGLVSIEEHGGGRQLVRIALKPWAPQPVAALLGLLAVITMLAFADNAWIAGGALAGLTALLGGMALRDSTRASAAWLEAAERLTAVGNGAAGK